MIAMKNGMIIIAVLVISLIASYILCDTKQNDVDSIIIYILEMLRIDYFLLVLSTNSIGEVN